jgi:hypothetical protein
MNWFARNWLIAPIIGILGLQIIMCLSFLLGDNRKLQKHTTFKNGWI